MIKPMYALDNSSHEVVEFKGKGPSVLAGKCLPVLVNVSVGLTNASSMAIERQKVEKILIHKNQPDLMMDLSITKGTPEMWEILQEEFKGPVGVVPHYISFDEAAGFSEARILSRVEYLMRRGISFLTIHAAPTLSLFRAASHMRMLPIGSRGGSVIVKDMILNKREESIYYKIFDTVAEMAAENGVVINLGTTFRAACIADGLDQVAVHELERQSELIQRAQAIGAQIVLEGPGHVLISEIDRYIALTQHLKVPLMPLGPIVSDAFPGLDHYVNLIGASYMMTRCQGGIINAITSLEHRGGLPSAADVIQALDAARVAAHVATISYHEPTRSIDKNYSMGRALAECCVLPLDFQRAGERAASSSGCSRCGHLCPLIKERYV